MSTVNSSYIGLRKDILKHVSGNNLTILDIGCATGENGRYLLKNNIASKVIGVEIDENMAEESKKKLTEVIVGNIELQDIKERMPKNLLYDFILLGDVLEHLNDPWKQLAYFRGLLKPGGQIVVSLPNVQHIDVFIHVFLKGKWMYNERGIFDKTHLKWFTFKNIIQLIDSANLSIVKVERNFRFRDKQGSKFPLHGILLKMLFKNLYTHQFIVVCKLNS